MRVETTNPPTATGSFVHLISSSIFSALPSQLPLFTAEATSAAASQPERLIADVSQSFQRCKSHHSKGTRKLASLSDGPVVQLHVLTKEVGFYEHTATLFLKIGAGMTRKTPLDPPKHPVLSFLTTRFAFVLPPTQHKS